MANPLFISISDASKLTGLSKSYLRGLARSGAVKYVACGTGSHARWMLNRRALEQELDAVLEGENDGGD